MVNKSPKFCYRIAPNLFITVWSHPIRFVEKTFSKNTADSLHCQRQEHRYYDQNTRAP